MARRSGGGLSVGIILFVTLALGGCNGVEREGEASAEDANRLASTSLEVLPQEGVPGPIGLASRYRIGPAPNHVLAACRRTQREVEVTVLCPSVLPQPLIGRPTGTLPVAAYARVLDATASGTIDYHVGVGHWDDVAGEEWRGRPCCSMHLQVGALGSSGERPRGGAAASVGGRDGTLVPANGVGAFYGNHLRFFFRHGGVEYVASLHDFGQEGTRAVLEALVRGLQPAADIRSEEETRGVETGRGPAAVVAEGDRLWTTGMSSPLAPSGRVVAIDPGDGAVELVRTLPGVPRDLVAHGDGVVVAFDRRSSDGARIEGAVRALDPQTDGGEQESVVFPGGNATAVASLGDELWVVDALRGRGARIDGSTLQQIGPRFAAGETPVDIYAGHGAVWVADAGGRAVLRLDPEGAEPPIEVPVDGVPVSVVGAAGSIWVGDLERGRIVEIDPAQNRVVGSVAVGAAPYGLAVDGDDLWVASAGEGVVTRIAAATASVVDVYETGGDPVAMAVGGGEVWAAHNTRGSIDPVRR